MIILRSNFYSKKKKDDREISGKRSVKSGLKAAGLTLAGGTTLGALGVGTLGRAGADVLTKNKKIIKRSRNLGATVGALGGAAQAAIPAAVIGTGYGLYKYASGYKKKEKEYSLKRQYQRAVGRARKKIVSGIESALLKNQKRSIKLLGELESIPAVKNKKATEYLHKEAGKHGIRITSDPELQMYMSDSLVSGRRGNMADAYSVPLSSSRIKEIMDVYEPEGKLGRKAKRLLRNTKEGKLNWGIYHDMEHGVDTLAHEGGHTFPSKRALKKAKGDPTLANQYHIKDWENRENIRSHKYDSVKNSLKYNRSLLKEEKRATKKGLELLKDSGTLSKEEMSRAKKRLKLAYKVHKLGAKERFLDSLHQKIQIPSRRVPDNFYKNPSPTDYYIREFKRSLIPSGI